jgi:hypothetical protein
MSGKTIDQLFPELFLADLVGSLPDKTMVALATEAARRGITALKLATELMGRYEKDRDFKCRIDGAMTEILLAAIKKQPYAHLVPRDIEAALLVQLLMHAEGKKQWPGVGKVVVKSIDRGNAFTIVRG